MRGAVWATMLGFNRPDMIEEAFQNFKQTVEPNEHPIIIRTCFDCSYPLPSKEENSRQLKALCFDYGWKYVPMKNDGVVENHNKAIFEHHKLADEDYYITFDPDVRMQQKGWLRAMVEILDADADMVFVCASRPFCDERWCIEQHGREVFTLASRTRLSSYRELIAWSVGMYKGWWLNRFMGRNFKSYGPNSSYGFGEHAQYALMRKHGKKWCQATDFYDHHLSAEAMFTRWKIEAANGSSRLSFEDWLIVQA